MSGELGKDPTREQMLADGSIFHQDQIEGRLRVVGGCWYIYRSNWSLSRRMCQRNPDSRRLARSKLLRSPITASLALLFARIYLELSSLSLSLSVCESKAILLAALFLKDNCRFGLPSSMISTSSGLPKLN